MLRVVALLAGILFGLGMTLSGMADPKNVIGFLDVAGEWRPELMFVMGGALAVFMPVYFLVIKPKSKPLVSSEFCVSSKKEIDGKLVGGAALFGAGWGLAGICPGPAVASLALGNHAVVVFFLSMMIGFTVVTVKERVEKQKLSAA